MKLKLFTLVLYIVSVSDSHAQTRWLGKQEIKEDIDFLINTLEEKSSYAYLNGYDFKKDLNQYVKNQNDSTKVEDFGIFITKTLAQIGDRHSSVNEIRGFRLNEKFFLPFIYAPFKGNVVVLTKNQEGKLELLNSAFPFLKKIDGIDIEEFIKNSRPEDIEAPRDTQFTMGVRDIRDIQKNYYLLGKELPKDLNLTFTDSTSHNDTLVHVSVIEKSKRQRPWDEKFETDYLFVKEEDFDKKETIEKLFQIEDKIAKIKIPRMVDREEAPLLFEYINIFMNSIKNTSDALIIDVRSNPGGTRDLLYEFAKYLIHPDSIHVINVANQRSKIPVSEDYERRLHGRFLFSFSELNMEEQKKVSEFLKSFKPMYSLNKRKYSENYYGVLNGSELNTAGYYYTKPVFILANEKTFSAASVFVSAFKGVSNIKIAGVTTDGSSGNSEWIDLPNSGLFGKISTMVSFQKNGEILDGIGTVPDIRIERDLDQILWQKDTQMEKLRTLILKDKK